VAICCFLFKDLIVDIFSGRFRDSSASEAGPV
jgi:hypothetical protein